jgi:protein-disulfide isomerase
MHYYLRRLIEQHPDRARLIHRHFPMDHKVNPGLTTPFHLGSGKMALLAIYASAKDKFWQMNDLLFGIAARKENFNLKEIAKKTGIDQAELVWALKNKLVLQRLGMDLKEGGELGLVGTPGFLIEGHFYQGNIPADVLHRIFNLN